ncbi:MAG: RNA 2',3'-cyclic phosphodiesterase [Terracidiphilus sp.]
MRLFVAIPLGAAVVGELSAICARLQSREDGLRWAAAESWHITLQFLGRTDEEQYKCVLSRLSAVRSAPVPIELEGLGFFERSGVFFAGVRVTPELAQLQQRVIAATEPCGFVSEARPFNPHITLARIKGSAPHNGLRALRSKLQGQPRFTRFVAREFLLYESFPGAEGSRYEVRERFALKNN